MPGGHKLEAHFEPPSCLWFHLLYRKMKISLIFVAHTIFFKQQHDFRQKIIIVSNEGSIQIEFDLNAVSFIVIKPNTLKGLVPISVRV